MTCVTCATTFGFVSIAQTDVTLAQPLSLWKEHQSWPIQGLILASTNGMGTINLVDRLPWNGKNCDLFVTHCNLTSLLQRSIFFYKTWFHGASPHPVAGLKCLLDLASTIRLFAGGKGSPCALRNHKTAVLMIGTGKLHFPQIPQRIWVVHRILQQYGGIWRSTWRWLVASEAFHWADPALGWWFMARTSDVTVVAIWYENWMRVVWKCLFCFWEGKRSWEVENLGIQKRWGMRDDIGIPVVFQIEFWRVWWAIPVIFSLGKSPSRCFTAHRVIFQFDTFLSRVAATLTKGA